MSKLTPSRRRAVDRLLIHYLELPEDEQDDFLNRCRQRWPRLRHWLDRLVEGGHTVTLLDDSVRRLAGDSVERIEINAGNLNQGDRLGPWEVIAEVGRGGMGRVYLGQRADGAFEMDVAIKQIGQRRRGLADLLRRESRLLARLDHPSVTRLVDAGLDDQAGPFLVMEWVDGADLSDWLTQANPDLETRLELFEQVAEAIAHAHQRLIVHGDIKPNNIRIRDDGSVKLMDFGVARLLASGERDEAQVRALTPAFAAPEQHAGEEITPASDTWSLGALLSWLLSGSAPAQGKAKMVPEKLPAGTPRPLELTAIVDQACADMPDQRYGSVRELLDDLKRYRQNEPIRAMPLGMPGRLWKFAGRNRLAVFSALGVATVLISAAILSTFLALQAGQERHRAEQSAETAQTVMEVQRDLLAGMEPNQLADGLLTGLRSRIRQGPDSERRMEVFNLIADEADATTIMREILVDQVIEPAANEMMARLDDNPLDMAALQDSLGHVYMRWGLYDEAVELFQLASDQYRQLLPDDAPEYYEATRQLFVALARSGDMPHSRELATQLLEEARKNLGPEHLATLDVEDAYAGLLLMLGQFQTGISLLESLADRRMELQGKDHPDALRSMHNQATGLLMSGQFETARQILEPVIEGRKRALGPAHPETLTSRGNLAGALVNLGELDEGLAMLEQVADIEAETFGRNHPTYLLRLSNIALVLRRLERLDEALEIENELVVTHKDVLGETNLETLRVRLNRATTLRELGDVEAAYKEFGKVAGLREEILGSDNPVALNSRIHEAHALWLMGQAEQAVEDFQALAERLDTSAGPLHEHSVTTQIFLARALDDLGQRDDAIAGLSQRLKIMDEQGVPEDDPDRVEMLTLIDELDNSAP